MTDPPPSPFVRDVIEFFVERRGKGTTVSAKDVHLVETWRDADVPVGVVLDGVELTFQKRLDPPKSLADCRRQVVAAIAAWRGDEAPDERGANRHDGGDGLGATPPSGENTPARGASTPSAPSNAPSSPPTPVAARARAALARLRARHDGPVAAALGALDGQIVRFVEARGDLDDVALEVLDNVLTELVFERLMRVERDAMARQLGAADGTALLAESVPPDELATRLARLRDLLAARYRLPSLRAALEPDELPPS